MSLAADSCAFCHRAHVSQGPALLSEAAPQSTLCFTCHDGVGSSLNIKAQYEDPSVPANDDATRSYYRHDALELSDHVLASDNEFEGVSNRHSSCADCHNPHNATPTESTQTADGWTVSGREESVSGVQVANGAAGTAPTYTFLDGTVSSKPQYEYEMCFKCHSGFTVLPDTSGQPPSRQALDKGIELNPANVSYHPVEAAGKNATTAMSNSLAGTSPYKQWNYTTSSTIRCVNCHGDPAKFEADAPPSGGAPEPTVALAPHTSQYRGILLQNYRDRTLKARPETYQAEDFALCFMCHAEAPMTNEGSSATRFPFHKMHVFNLDNLGAGGTDIDTPGAGQGNAVCAECHFRIHSTALRTGTQGEYSRLVNFAPNVTAPTGGTISFTPRPSTGSGSGSCTLTCHGVTHQGEPYP